MNKEWEKIVYKETSDKVNILQGFVEDLGDFLEVKGTYKHVLVNKQQIISRTIKQGSKQNDEEQN